MTSNDTQTSTDPVPRLLHSIEAAVADERNARWAQGDAILRLMETIGHMPAYRSAAKLTGKSVRWAIELAKVAQTFPEAERGRADWSVYRVAANTDDPHRWLSAAIEEQLSAKELSRLIYSN